MTPSPLYRLCLPGRGALIALLVATALASASCKPRSWRSGGPPTEAHPANGSGGGWWRSGPEVEADLSETDATVEGIRAVLATLDAPERTRVLAPFVPYGPQLPVKASIAGADGTVERVVIPAPRREEVDLPSVVRQLQRVHKKRDLVLAALFVGTDPVARSVAKLRKVKGRRAVVTLDTVSRRFFRSEYRAMKHVRAAQKWATAYALSWPVDRRFYITSVYGPRYHPVTGHVSNHRGVDIGVPLGTEIRAPAEGKISRIRYGRANGRWLEIDHGHGVRTMYCHLSRARAKKGQKVKLGQLVAESGNTGRVTGPHLHYQVKLSGVFVDPLGTRLPSESLGAWVPLSAPAPVASQAAMK